MRPNLYKMEDAKGFEAVRARASVEGEMPCFDEPYDFVERFADARAQLFRVAVEACVLFKLVFVEHSEGEVGEDEHVNVEVNEGERVGFEARGRVDVAVEASEATVAFAEAKDAVPAVRPEELKAVRAGLYGSENLVSNLFGEGGFEDDERTF